ncbi:hypothetical protein FPV67DRAFT_1488641 [Lyophyllum atratum]|nr:hypothetical protein FPV67DRAFT_1488641 [Lyophyllum atratum]
MEVERGIGLVHKLATILSSSPVSLEILPGGLEEWVSADTIEEKQRPTLDFPFLYSDGNLGIPKKVLYKVYLSAIALFKSSRSVPELCRISTCVILLTNPGHQTALNARKRLVENDDLEPEKELEFTQVLLRGPSDCAKQSILWDHRRWLFGRIYTERLHLGKRYVDEKWTTAADLRALPDIPPGVVISELSLIREACESHPRNYPAWTHWHFIVDAVNAQLRLNADSSNVWFDILEQELKALSHWVDLHVSDHSAVFHLCSLGRLFGDLEGRHLAHSRHGIPSTAATNASLVKHALSLIASYPSHEALWIYLRESAALLPTKEREQLVEQVGFSTMFRGPLATRFVAWMFAYCTPGSEGDRPPQYLVN